MPQMIFELLFTDKADSQFQVLEKSKTKKRSKGGSQNTWINGNKFKTPLFTHT